MPRLAFVSISAGALRHLSLLLEYRFVGIGPRKIVKDRFGCHLTPAEEGGSGIEYYFFTR